MRNRACEVLSKESAEPLKILGSAFYVKGPVEQVKRLVIKGDRVEIRHISPIQWLIVFGRAVTL